MTDALYRAKERLQADLSRAREALKLAQTDYLVEQANNTVKGTEMLLEALDRQIALLAPREQRPAAIAQMKSFRAGDRARI